MLAAGSRGAPNAKDALADLCRIYWYPLYAFVRRQGYNAAEAQDLTQEFFTRLLEKNYIKAAECARGRFRSFLLASMKHFLSNERDRSQALKRGGGKVVVALDYAGVELRYSHDTRYNLTPERIYERQWALSLLDHVLEQLRQELFAAGKSELFDEVKELLTHEGSSVSYAERAKRLRMTEGALKVAAHRLRRRYRHLLQEAIGQTVAEPGEIEDEIRYLMTVIGS